MKKKILVAITILILCVAFVSCGQDMADSPHVGTWKGVDASYSGISMSVESIIGGEMTFELKDDGKCILNIAGAEESGKWSETEDGFSIEDELDFKVDGDKATLDSSGVIITLEKQ